MASPPPTFTTVHPFHHHRIHGHIMVCNHLHHITHLRHQLHHRFRGTCRDGRRWKRRGGEQRR
ncbi:hypothetical protein Hdeb2414_s0002g00061441 [Helianthus debilis subsp. tardiflorus]